MQQGQALRARLDDDGGRNSTTHAEGLGIHNSVGRVRTRFRPG